MKNTIRQVLVKNTWLDGLRDLGLEYGWGNGYVGIPKRHPWYGKDHDYISCSVHGNLTFSKKDAFGDGYWWIGFDTSHGSDNQDNCNLNYVAEETQRLADQAEEARSK